MNRDELRRCMFGRWLDYVESLHESGIAVQGNPNVLFEELDRRYREEHRHYHSWAHIAACLDELDSARSLALHPAAVELALWFHDAVYVPGAPDNEQRSARMARDAAKRLDLPGTTAAEAEKLVLATRYLSVEDTPEGASAPPCRQDCALIRDIDLSILGKPPSEFDRYEEAIRREYSSLPDAERWQRRIDILEGFLALPRIFETEHFQRRYEQQARRNLSHSVSRLRKLLTG